MNGDAAEHLARAKGQAAAAAKRTEPFVAVVAPAPAAPAARAARASRATPTPTPRPAPTGPKGAAPSPRAATAPSPAAAAKPDFVVEHGSLAEPEPPVAASKPSSDIETFDGAIGFNAVAHDAARAEGLEVQEDVVFEPQKQDVEGLAQTQYESGMLAIPEPPRGLLDEELPQVDLPLIMPEDVMPAATPRAATPPRPPSPPHVPAPSPPTAPTQGGDSGPRCSRPVRRRRRGRSGGAVPGGAGADRDDGGAVHQAGTHRGWVTRLSGVAGAAAWGREAPDEGGSINGEGAASRPQRPIGASVLARHSRAAAGARRGFLPRAGVRRGEPGARAAGARRSDAARERYHLARRDF